MTSGIYSLIFGGKYVYIGKSINIENRWKQHWDKMTRGTAAKNVQDAYNMYGAPKASIIAEAHPDHIDLLETIAIEHNKHLNLLNAAGTVNVNEDDAKVLLSNAELISKSTANHIREITNLRHIVDEQQETIEDYKRNGIVIPSEIVENRKQLRELNAQLIAATNAVIYWKAEAQKSWWQRLFS